MSKIDRWLLPDGIDEILPNRALKVERLRRRLLDTCHAWGYDLVIPPLAEYTDSLLSGSGSDLDLMTFKITDQLSGRMMGVRADITPQVARMDAHSLQRQSPNRLCYAGQVLYTRPKGPLETRAPIQLGVELFGEAGREADIEVISLLQQLLSGSGVSQVHLDLGHVGVYRELERAAGLSEELSAELFALVQRKDASLSSWLDRHVGDSALRAMLAQLPGLCGGDEVLGRAEQTLAEAGVEVLRALADLKFVYSAARMRAPEFNYYLDLSELRGYNYHTGIVFAAYAGRSAGGKTSVPIGNGGRYDDVGAAFGRARPATGFGVDLVSLADLVAEVDAIAPGVFVPVAEVEGNGSLEREIERLRDSGERVVRGFRGQAVDFEELHCDRVLSVVNGEFRLRPVREVS